MLSNPWPPVWQTSSPIVLRPSHRRSRTILRWCRLVVCRHAAPGGPTDPSIFTFGVRDPTDRGRRLSVAELRPLYARLARTGVLLGQPVGLGRIRRPANCDRRRRPDRWPPRRRAAPDFCCTAGGNRTVALPRRSLAETSPINRSPNPRPATPGSVISTGSPGLVGHKDKHGRSCSTRQPERPNPAHSGLRQ